MVTAIINVLQTRTWHLKVRLCRVRSWPDGLRQGWRGRDRTFLLDAPFGIIVLCPKLLAHRRSFLGLALLLPLAIWSHRVLVGSPTATLPCLLLPVHYGALHRFACLRCEPVLNLVDVALEVFHLMHVDKEAERIVKCLATLQNEPTCRMDLPRNCLISRDLLKIYIQI